MGIKYTGKTTITREEYLQLVGLEVLGKQHVKMLKEIEKAIQSITGETESGGHSSDVLWDDYGVDGLLKRLGLTVQEDHSDD